MNEQMTISQLETIFKLIIEKLKTEKFDFTTIEFDYYWNILGSDLFEFDNPPEPSVGSLSDDISSLNKAAEQGEIFSVVEFNRAAGLLRAISQTIIPG